MARKHEKKCQIQCVLARVRGLDGCLWFLMVWNNVRNASHGATARCIIQHSFGSHSRSNLFFLSITFSLRFSLPAPTHFCLRCVFAFEILHFTLMSHSQILPLPFFFLWTESENAILHPLSYLLNWLNLNALKPICLSVPNCWTV